MKKLLIILSLLIAEVSVAQQKVHDYAVIDPAKWIIPNSGGLSYALTDYKGSKALIIKKNFNAPQDCLYSLSKESKF